MLTFTEPSTAIEIQETFPLMAQLRPHLDADSYVDRVSCIMRNEGFRLAALRSEGRLAALAGYRYMTTLHGGKSLYIDDFVVDAPRRGSGMGSHLLWWLEGRARQEQCRQVHLISHVAREAAHRFYFSNNFGMECLHFRRKLRFQHFAPPGQDGPGAN